MFATQLAWAALSHSPLVPEGQIIDNPESVLSATSRSNYVYAVAFSPDGNTLASGSSDNSIRLWDVQSGKERQVLLGHLNPVWSVAFSPDSDSLASGSLNGTLRLWTQSDRLRQDYQFKLVLIGGVHGAWVSCRANGKCLRYDNGTLLWRRDEQGYLHPIPLPRPKEPSQLEALTQPEILTTNSGQYTPFTLQIINRGQGHAYWINAVQDVVGHEGSPLLFYPPLTHVELKPGETAELSCFVSAPADYDHPMGGKTTLHLNITSAHGDPLAIEIPVMVRTPSLEWGEARWLKKINQDTLSISLINRGEQALSTAEFRARISGRAQPLDRIIRETPIQPGETANLSFALPATLAPKDKLQVSLNVRQTTPPGFRWRFSDQSLTVTPPPWPLYTSLAVLLVGSTTGVYYLRLYRHPLVTRVSAQPEALLQLVPEELPKAQQLLTRTRRLPSILNSLGVQSQWLEGAMAFSQDDAEARAKALARRLAVECQGAADNDPFLWTLPLGAGFPLNLEQCLLYLAPGELAPTDIVVRLRSKPETMDQVTMVLSPNAGYQTELHQQVSGAANLWVAPSPDELTRLLLSTDPIQELARLIASQVEVTRVSPYQTGGGANKESVFFGRRHLLSHIINREPANYLVVGGRQLGKSSLLKAIERLYQDHPQVHCYYLVLSNRSLIDRLSRALGLPRETSLDGVLDYLSGLHQGRYLFLIDEADSFIHAERNQDYSTLQQLRSLSEEGRCHFILAGFWELYESAVLDYQSPLKNFGETLTIGALETEACRELITQPMATMNIRYASPDSIDHLVAATGQRANLISIACNEILKNLSSEDRVIDADDVKHALSSDAVRRALSGWETLAADDADGNRLDRIIVYATIEQNAFSLAELLAILETENYPVAPERVMRSLERLELAYVIGQVDGRYAYRVPLFREMALAREPRRLLQRELAYEG